MKNGYVEGDRGRITARVPQHIVDMLNIAANIMGATLNQFVTQAALEKAEKVIDNERAWQVSQETAAWFFSLLENPPATNAALSDAFMRYDARKTNDAGADSIFELKP